MEVLVSNSYRHRDDKLMPLQEYVEGKLSGFDYDSGELETLRRQTTRNTEAIAKLLEKLVEFRVLQLPEVVEIVGGGETLEPYAYGR